MTRPEERQNRKREVMLEMMADHLLSAGIGGANLRALARSAGTSDRMLLYYFPDKDAIMGAVMQTIAARLAARLESIGDPAAPVAPDVLLPSIRAAMRTPALGQVMALWLEVCALAGRDVEPFRSLAGGIAQGFLAWAEARVAAPDAATRRALAARLLATIDGMALLDAAGLADAADAAAQAPPADQ